MQHLFKNMYKNRRVLVTGHTGFKGSWMCMWLKEMGANVIGYSLEPNTTPSIFKVCNLDRDITSIIGDIRDEENLFSVIEKYKPEIVFNMAAQPLVRVSYIEPKLTYETNVIGTLNLLESVRRSHSVKAVINITTDKCYENNEWVYGYRENDPMGGFDPYSSSKACSEILTSSYRNSFFNKLNIGLATARAGNVIGGGDWSEDRLIPDIVKSISQNKDIVIRNPNAIRPWQHVLEPLSGYLWLGALILNDDWRKYSDPWNFGPSDDILNVEEVLKLAIKYWGRGSYILDKSENVHEAGLLKLDISKAKTLLNWKPVYNTEQSIYQTILWYKEYYDNKNCNMREYTINQIKDYVKQANENNIEWSK